MIWELFFYYVSISADPKSKRMGVGGHGPFHQARKSQNEKNMLDFGKVEVENY